jgi:tetraacyldisaccharide 4'-kinase
MGRDADVVTISVGNLTVGGTGKTPFALYLANRLAADGNRVAIVSRGYRRSGRGAALVANAGRLLLTPRLAGDEPAMMARSFRGPIAIARRRIDAIRMLVEHATLDVVVLDDGFQHLPLHRDLDLILVNEARGFGNGWVLPTGPLREPIGTIARADAVVLIATRGDGDGLRAEERSLLESKPLLRATIRPRSLIRLEGREWREAPLALRGRSVVAVSGLADPTGFHSMLRMLGAELAAVLDYPDHHDYGPGDWENILDAARGAELVLTTEKDLIKLERFSPAQISLYALRVEVTMSDQDEARLFGLIAQHIPRRASAPSAAAASSQRE